MSMKIIDMECEVGSITYDLECVRQVTQLAHDTVVNDVGAKTASEIAAQALHAIDILLEAVIKKEGAFNEALYQERVRRKKNGID